VILEGCTLKIELDAPNVGELEKRYLERCINAGFVSTYGPFVPEFEEKFAKYLGAKKAVSTQSGTSALHVSLYEHDMSPGYEVIVPVLTLESTAYPIM